MVSVSLGDTAVFRVGRAGARKTLTKTMKLHSGDVVVLGRRLAPLGTTASTGCLTGSNRLLEEAGFPEGGAHQPDHSAG